MPANAPPDTPSERKLLGRFYAAEVVREVLNLIFPFQFVYLFLVVERPEWAVLPVIVASITVFFTEIPTGVVADRFGRKRSVIAGFLLTAVAWALVPLATRFAGEAQLVALCGAFALAGLSQTLYSGAEEAWVVDNLRHAGRADLVGPYFAKIRSFASVGGVFAGGLALAMLLLFEVDRTTLDLLWYVGAMGYVVSVVLVASIAEERADDDDEDDDDEEEDISGNLFQRLHIRLSLLFRRRGLLALVLGITVAAFAGAAPDEAFDMALVTRGMNAKLLAPLGILDDLIGIVAPLFGMWAARRFGTTPVLVAFIALPALLTLVFFTGPGVPILVLLWALFDFMDDVWDPVSETRMHELIPSRQRATISSIANQFIGIAEMAGLGAFALLLGDKSEELKAATPDLIEAFSTGVTTTDAMPRGWFDLPLPDLAIVLFVTSGILSIPFLLLARRQRHDHDGDAA